MNSSDAMMYIMLGIAGILVWYLIITYATRADRQVKNQQAMIDLLIKLCEKQGVTQDEIDGIRNARGIK